jgi:hypothetical protein
MVSLLTSCTSAHRAMTDASSIAAPTNVTSGSPTGLAAASTPTRTSSLTVAATTAPPPVTDLATASRDRFGSLAVRVAGATVLCKAPNQAGYCTADSGQIKGATDAVCRPFAAGVLGIARVSGVGVDKVGFRSTVLAQQGGASTVERTWQVVVNCVWTPRGQIAPAAAMKIGLGWQRPVITDCSASPIGTCTQLTPRMFRVTDGDKHTTYRINGILGGAEIYLNTTGAVGRAESTAAAVLAAKVATSVLTGLDK